MANPEHLEILNQGVDVWNQWREDSPEIIPELSGGNLGGAKLAQVNLSQADLREITLGRADLFQANLSGANLYLSDLTRADFSRANLSQANLTGASLFETNCSRCDLIGTVLLGANLFGTIFNRADLNKTNFSRAMLAYTLFIDVDLSDTQGLTDIQHRAPSSIGIDTLYRSGGKIPEVFLRGCGVPDSMIEFAKSLGGNPIKFYHCFISYSSADEEFAVKLNDSLQNAGIRCWFAPDRILPGERIDLAIHEGIQQSVKLVFCASKSSLTEKWWVDFEVDKAFKKARDLQREQGKNIDVIIPLNLDNYLFSKEFDQHPKRSIFEMIHAENFVGWEEDTNIYDRQVERVIRALRTDGGKEPPPESKL